MSVGAGDNKTLPERLRAWAAEPSMRYRGENLLRAAAVTLEAAEKAQRVRDAVLAGRDDRITELQARLVAVEAERDEALAALKDEMQWDMGGVPENEWMRRAIAAEARVAENAELKGLKAGGDRPEAVAVAEKLQALAVAAHDFVIQANIYIPPATTRLMGTRRELVSLVDAVLNPAPAAAVRPQTDTPDQALSEFLAASIAVWRSIDEREAMPGGYSAQPLTQDTELRKIERAAWERYRETLSEAGSSAADTSVGERQGRQPASLSACARCVALTDALREIAALDTPSDAEDVKDYQALLYHRAVDIAAAVLASSVKQEQGQELGGSAAARSGGGS